LGRAVWAAAVAVMRDGEAERPEVVVAVRRAVGVVARAAVVGRAVVVVRAVATLGVVVAVAEAGVQLVFHGSLHYCPAVMSINNADANFFIFF